ARSGRPKILDTPKKLELVETALKDRRAPIHQLAKSLDVQISTQTVVNYLNAHGIGRYKAAKKPLLKENHIEARLKWCQEHSNWTVEDWRKVVWSDESTVEIGHFSQEQNVWRRTGERYMMEC